VKPWNDEAAAALSTTICGYGVKAVERSHSIPLPPFEPEYYRGIREGLKVQDSKCRVLYKYQAFRPYTCKALRENLVKFSSHSELNDAFDLAVQFAEPFGPTYGDIHKFRELITPHAGIGYKPPRDLEDILEYLSGRSYGFLEPLVACLSESVTGAKSHCSDNIIWISSNSVPYGGLC
jgi:hypothetical protein